MEAPLEKEGALIQPGSRMQYMLAGRSIVTIVGKRSRFTYLIKKAPKASGKLWVSVLAGTENANESNYRFIGTIVSDSTEYKPFFRHSPRSAVSLEAPSVQAFLWAFKNAEDPQMAVYHSGRCGRCGRRLTTPESITTGLGPVCAGRAGDREGDREGEEEPAPAQSVLRSSHPAWVSPRVRAEARSYVDNQVSIAEKHHGVFA